VTALSAVELERSFFTDYEMLSSNVAGEKMFVKRNGDLDVK
jgi:hypothetical protein